MSSKMLHNENTDNLLACRACLAINRKLYSINQNHLLEAYRNLTGIDVNTYDNLPQYVCNFCTTLLMKYSRFRDHCRQAREHLGSAQISLDYLNTFKPYIQLNTTETVISTQNDNTNEENLANVLKIYDTNHQFDIYDDSIHQFDNHDDTHHPDPFSSLENESELKVYTELVKIEMPDSTEVVKRKKFSHLRKKSRTNDKIKKKGKYFETQENMEDFEKAFDVGIVILSKEQQMKEFLERKASLNYLHSPYKCDMCYKGYMGAETLNKHIQSQHDPSRGNVVCEFCKFRYKDQRGLTQHMKSHRLKFACKQCPYVSKTTFNAKEHFKMHGGKMHECQHCGKSYEKLSSHLSHLRMQHPADLIWCDVCGEAFIGTFGLNAHKKRAHRYLSLPATCKLCDKRFADAAALKRHSSRDTCSGHTCVQCGEAFTEALELRDHLLEKHRSCKRYSCEKCDKTFTRESFYSAHYRRLHVDPEQRVGLRKETPWICEVCGKSLPNKCMLRYHQRNHTGEKPFQCMQCPKKFTMRKLLQSHQRAHTSDRPYACKLCPKTFKGLSALRTHEHIHAGDSQESRQGIRRCNKSNN